MLLIYGVLCIALLAAIASVARWLAPPGDHRAATAGALAFAAFPVLYFGFLHAASLSVPVLPLDPWSEEGKAGLLVVVLGAVAQEVCRLLSLLAVILILRKLPSAEWHGLGFGAAELLYISLGTIASSIALFLPFGSAVTLPELSAFDVLLGIIERFSAIAGHIVYSYVACFALARRKRLWLIVPFGGHAAINMLGAAMPRDYAIAVVFVGTLTVATVTILFVLHRKLAWLR